METTINISENIKRYRYLKNLTQEELARASGVSLITIKKLEGGRPGIRPKTIEAIAAALNIASDSLNEKAKRLKTIRFRSCRNLRSKEGIVAYIIDTLEKYNSLENMTNIRLPKTYLKAKNIKGAMENAVQCRKLAGLDNTSPIYDISEAIHTLGIKLFSVDINTELFFSLSVGEEDGGPAIVVNSNSAISYEKSIFSIAHELGHFFMHRGVKKEINDEIIWAEEDEADLFASYFLMPDEGLRKLWDASFGLHWTDKVIKVKQIYGMHYKTVLHRIGLIKGFGYFDKLRDLFLKEYDNGSLKEDKDPKPLQKKIYIEEHLYSLVLGALDKNMITLDEGAKILRIDKNEMKRLLKSAI